MALLSYAKLPLLSQVEAIRNLSILYNIYGYNLALNEGKDNQPLQIWRRISL
jgi:hypothetical protein